MKKLLVVLILGLVYTTRIFAQDKIPSSVLASFQNDFTHAENTAWSSVKDLYRVDFTVADQKASAFFNSAGNFVASSRQVTSLQIPMFLKSSLSSSFSDYDVIDLFEVDKESGVTYYATIKNSKKQLMLESISGEWVRYNKQSIL